MLLCIVQSRIFEKNISTSIFLPTFGHISIQLLDSSWTDIEALLLRMLALPLDGRVTERFLVPCLSLLVGGKEQVVVFFLVLILTSLDVTRRARKTVGLALAEPQNKFPGSLVLHLPGLGVHDGEVLQLWVDGQDVFVLDGVQEG